MEPFRQDALFWHSVWKSAGRPNTGELHKLMAHTRNKFHYAVRVTKRQGKLIKAKKLFEASLISEVDLLKEMKAVKRGGRGHEELPEHVSGQMGRQKL